MISYRARQSISRRRFIAAGAAGAAAVAAGSGPRQTLAADVDAGASYPSPPALVSATPAQTMQGFGASGAW